MRGFLMGGGKRTGRPKKNFAIDLHNSIAGLTSRVRANTAADLKQRPNTCCHSAISTNPTNYVCRPYFPLDRQRISSPPGSRKQPISYRKHLSGKNLDCRGRRSPPPAPKTSGIYDKITDISKMRKKRTADWPDYHSEHLTKEKSGNRLLSLLRREVIPLCHRNNDNKKEECISYIPLFRPELFRKKSTGNG